jgi:bifunctional UDP-N-acetylglucosamine pyrophosphorylase/glucosamine-1-phosphate N-acetyltransferase
MKTVAVVLAAGKGVRMKSDIPKVSHVIFGKPMVVWVLEAIKILGIEKVFVVVGYKAEMVREECGGFDAAFIEQREQLGTGHAVMQTAPFIREATVLILPGDMPLIKPETLRRLIESHTSKNASATVLTAALENPFSYGRIIRSADGQISKIVEQKDATAPELSVNEVNSGAYCFNSKDLFSALEKVRPDNAQKEYYLTDVIGILKGGGLPVYAYRADDPGEIVGINTIEELKKLELRGMPH